MRDLIQAAHQNSKDKGFWDADKNAANKLALIASELIGEAFEAYRCNKFANIIQYKLDFERKTGHLSDEQVKQFFHEESFIKNIKGTFEEEIADVVIRYADFCGGFEIQEDEWDVVLKAGREGEISRFVHDENECGPLMLNLTHLLAKAAQQERVSDGYWKGYVHNFWVNFVYCVEEKWNVKDIMEIVRIKMLYNKTRERLHGKKF